MSTAVVRQPVIFAGFPAGSWAFAVRIWLAVVAALYASFWLELESPSSAAVTVAILAVPTRGQGLEKAGFRLIATVIGVAASIAIIGAFAQTGGLILAVFAAWIGVCVYAAGMLDGNRAYAAALCIITVAFIAIQQIDSPQDVFEAGLARGAALGVGVLAVTLVNDLLAAPDYHPKVTAQLEALRRRVADYARSAVRGQAMPAMMAAGLLREITALRPEIASLATESSSGQARSAAARTVAVELVAELAAARALEALPVAAAPVPRERIVSELDGNSGVIPTSSFRARSSGRDESPSGVMAIGLSWLTENLLRRNGDVRESLDALRVGTYPSREWRTPLYRSRRIAAENGVRAAIYFALASTFFVFSGWPTTEICLSLVAILIGLSATVPDARAFTALAVVSAPTASLLAGILEFVVLDGVTGFPLLAIALAPFVIGLTLLITLPNPILSTLGRLNLIFTLALFSPSNPQTYDPETFLFSGLFSCIATSLLFAIQRLIPPLSNDSRLQRLLGEARHDLGNLGFGRDRRLAPEEATFRDAARIGQIMAAGGAAPQDRQAFDDAMSCFDRAATLRLCAAQLDRLANGPLTDIAEAARTSLARRDGAAILASARALREAAFQRDPDATAACAALVLASVAFTVAPPPDGGTEKGEP